MINVVLRVFDVVISSVGLVLLSPVLITIYILSMFDTGSPLFLQERVGRGRKAFVLVKFRTMRCDAESVASHLADPSAVTPFGAFLRRNKLDELPQLWNVIKGEMTLVGPRPCLFSQTELIKERNLRGIFTVRPGITGLAQLASIDMSTPRLLAETEERMIKVLNITVYLKYILMTFVGKGSGDRIPIKSKLL